MPRQLEAVGNIKAGKLYIVERVKFDDALTHLPEGPVTLLVKSTGKKRTNPANRYYHGVVVRLIRSAIVEQWGEDLSDEEVHALLKERFNTATIDTENGTVTFTASTSRLDTAEFMAYVEKCRNWAAEFFGIDIPDPVKIENANQSLPV